MEQVIMLTRNERGIEIKKCCASCAHKCITPNSIRICTLTNEKVDSGFLCRGWAMSEGMQHAGRFRGGVVRDIDTKEVVIV